MQLDKTFIQEHNALRLAEHRRKFQFLAGEIPVADDVVQKLIDFQIAIPSWALGTGGTRFGRFPGGGEPRSLEEKMEDVGLLHASTAAATPFPCIFPGTYRLTRPASGNWLPSSACDSMQ